MYSSFSALNVGNLSGMSEVVPIPILVRKSLGVNKCHGQLGHEVSSQFTGTEGVRAALPWLLAALLEDLQRSPLAEPISATVNVWAPKSVKNV